MVNLGRVLAIDLNQIRLMGGVESQSKLSHYKKVVTHSATHLQKLQPAKCTTSGTSPLPHLTYAVKNTASWIVLTRIVPVGGRHQRQRRLRLTRSIDQKLY